MQKGDRVKGKGGADSLIDNCKEPIRLLHWLNIQIWLHAEDIADHRIQTDVIDDGFGNHTEVVDELIELFPCLAFREDRVKGPVVAPGHGRHNGNGDGGALVGPIAGDLSDAAGDVLQAGSDSAASSVHRLCCGVGCVEEGLDL